VAEAFAAGFLTPVIPSLGCGPFGTALVRMVEPVFSLPEGFLRVPVSVFCFLVKFVCSKIGPTSCGEDPRCPGKAIVKTEGRHVPEHTV